MKRTKLPQPSKNISYSIDEEPIVLSKPLLDIFLSKSKPAELISLYCFYYYTAKWQKTNQVKATTGYVGKGLKWNLDKVRRWKKELILLGLVEDIIARGTGNRIVGHYIKVNFIWKNSTIKSKFHTTENPECGKSLTVENPETNALSSNNINALSTNSFIVASQFEKFWRIYPRKTDKGKALTKWNNICSKKSTDRPKWRVISRAVRKQKKSDRWQDPKFIPHPTTWLNQSRWLDDPEEMKNRETTESDIILEYGRKWYKADDGAYYAKDGTLYEG